MGLLRSRALPWTLFALAAVAAGAFAYLWRVAAAPGAQRAAVEGATRRFVRALTNFSSQTIDADVEEIRSFATGSFAEEVDTLFSPETIAAVKEAGASSRGEVRSIYVERLDEGEARVFVVVDETRSNDLSPAPVTDTVRMAIRLVLEDGTWKVAHLRLFQTPAEQPSG
jgi:hypothetical protein